MTRFTESVVEDAALAWLEAQSYTVLHGPDIAAGELGAERSDPNYRDVVLDRRHRAAVRANFARAQAVVAKNATTRLLGNIPTMRIAVSKKATVSKREIVRRSGCRCV